MLSRMALIRKYSKNEIENKNGNASMIMLGNAVFSDIPFLGCRKLRINNKKACLL